MSGALKHFFDVVYYPVLDDTRGLPYGLYVHGNLDTAGAIAAVETITGALGWQRVARAGRDARPRPTPRPARPAPNSPPRSPPRSCEGGRLTRSWQEGPG